MFYLKSCLYTIYFIVFASTFSNAQNKLMDTTTHRILINYAVYNNETVHGLWILHTEFSHWNDNMIRVVEKISKNFYYDAYKESAFEGEYNFEIKPKEAYTKCIQESKKLTTAQQQLLNPIIDSMQTIIVQLAHIEKQLGDYQQNKVYKTDSTFSQAFIYLQQAEVLFSAYRIWKDSLEIAMEQVYNSYATPQKPLVCAQFVQNWIPFTKVVKKVIHDTWLGDTTHIAQYYYTIDTMLKRLEMNEKAIAEQLDKEEKLPTNLSVSISRGTYELMLHNAQVYRPYTLKVIQPDKRFSNKNLYPHTDNYYRYNNELLNKFNRYGVGFGHYYNNTLAACPICSRWILEEPHQFKVEYPKPIIVKTEPLVEPKKDTIIPTPSILTGFAHNNWVLLLDISASMNTTEKLSLLQNTLSDFLTVMRPEDKIAIVTYSGKAKLVLPSTSATEKDRIIDVIKHLHSEGMTNADEGFSLAYQTVLDNLIQDGNNRILAATDGQFAISKRTQQLIEKNTKKAISLSIFYVGNTPSTSIQAGLTQLAQTGKGNYFYLQSNNAHDVFVKEAQAVKAK